MGSRSTTAIVLAGILAGCADTPPGTEPNAAWPVFCYRTLADVGCYTEMDRGRERRLTGIYLAVGDPWWIVYATPGAEPGAAEAQEAGAGPLPLFPVSP
jgi:hypothetical protein